MTGPRGGFRLIERRRMKGWKLMGKMFGGRPFADSAAPEHSQGSDAR